MARPRSARKAADAGSVFIRFTADEYTKITGAMAAQAKGVIGGGTITVAAFTRAIVVREAEKILAGK